MSGRSNHFNHSFYDDHEAGGGVTQVFMKSEERGCIREAGLGSVWRKDINTVQDLWLKGVIGEYCSDQLRTLFDSRLTVLSNQFIRFLFHTFLTAIGIN